jgi:hypothetical protein
MSPLTSPQSTEFGEFAVSNQGTLVSTTIASAGSEIMANPVKIAVINILAITSPKILFDLSFINVPPK